MVALYEVPRPGEREMFIVDLESPSRAVRKVQLLVKVCPKTVWAIATNGRRYLIGSSAFQTMAAAERCRIALLQKIVADPRAAYFAPWRLDSAKKALAKAGKTVH